MKNRAQVTEDKVKEEGKVIAETKPRKEAEVDKEKVAVERLIQEAAMKIPEEVDEVVTEVTKETTEEGQREEGNTIHAAEMNEGDEVSVSKDKESYDYESQEEANLGLTELEEDVMRKDKILVY